MLDFSNMKAFITQQLINQSVEKRWCDIGQKGGGQCEDLII